MIVSARVRFGHLRSSKVIDFVTNQSAYATSYSSVIVILVLICTVLEIFQIFLLMTPPYSTVILGVFPSDQIADVGVNVSRYLKLFGREIIFEVFQPR